MTLRNGRRLLLFAFALSLLVHLIFAIAWHRPNHSRAGEIEVVSIQRRPVNIERMRTPPPRPHVTPVPHPAPRTRPAPKSPKATRPAGGTGGTGRASAAPSAAPTPAPANTTGNPCAQPNSGAAIVASPPPADIPVAARTDGTSGIALVKVQLDDTGAITTAAVSQSTGNPALDDVAVTMAKGARYAPALKDCKPIAGDYTFSVKFVAW